MKLFEILYEANQTTIEQQRVEDIRSKYGQLAQIDFTIVGNRKIKGDGYSLSYSQAIQKRIISAITAKNLQVVSSKLGVVWNTVYALPLMYRDNYAKKVRTLWNYVVEGKDTTGERFMYHHYSGRNPASGQSWIFIGREGSNPIKLTSITHGDVATMNKLRNARDMENLTRVSKISVKLSNVETTLLRNRRAMDIYYYAKNKLHTRWPEGEKIIATDPRSTYLYLKNVVKDRDVTLERGLFKNDKYIAVSPHTYAIKYFVNVLNSADKTFAKKLFRYPGAVYLYASDVLRGRVREGEPAILKNPWLTYQYAKHIMHRRWLKAEPILRNSEYWDDYKNYFGIK